MLNLSVKTMMSELLTLFCREADLTLSSRADIPTRFLNLSVVYGDQNSTWPVYSDII